MRNKKATEEKKIAALEKMLMPLIEDQDQETTDACKKMFQELREINIGLKSIRNRGGELRLHKKYKTILLALKQVTLKIRQQKRLH